MQGIAVLSIRAGGRTQRLKPHSKQAVTAVLKRRHPKLNAAEAAPFQNTFKTRSKPVTNRIE